MDEILLRDYDPAWPERFAREADRLRAVMPPEVLLRLEHFGSTAVPGLEAKPIIDLLAVVSSLDEARGYVDAIEARGYSFWRGNPDPARLFFVKGLPPEGPRTHHLHMVASDNTKILERLIFRDYLRAHPEEAGRYGALKRRLAAQFPDDREAYTDGKSDYVHGVLQKAKDERKK